MFSDAKCNSTTEFQCSNSNCIPLEKLNNTINDCGDNSDEGMITVKLYSIITRCGLPFSSIRSVIFLLVQLTNVALIGLHV